MLILAGMAQQLGLCGEPAHIIWVGRVDCSTAAIDVDVPRLPARARAAGRAAIVAGTFGDWYSTKAPRHSKSERISAVYKYLRDRRELQTDCTDSKIRVQSLCR